MEEKTREEIEKWVKERKYVVAIRPDYPLENRIELILNTVEYIEKGLELVLRALLENEQDRRKNG